MSKRCELDSDDVASLEDTDFRDVPYTEGCVVEAGCYITGGSKITLPDSTVVKAKELSGANGLLFRRNSVSGALEAVTREGTWGGLNEALHKN